MFINPLTESRRGITLLLDRFGVHGPFCFDLIPRTPEMWGLSMAPQRIDAYVNNFIVPYVRHVVHELGCRSVKWFSHVNEPFGGGDYSTPPVVDQHRHYVAVVRAIRQGLDEAGLSHIGQLGPDCSDCRIWPVPAMVEKGADPDPFLAGYCLHNYHSRFDWAADADNLEGGTAPISRLMEDHVGPVTRYAHERGKPFFLTELGNFYYGWKWGDPAGITRHDNVLGELEFTIRAMAHGCDGVLRWAWLNPGTMDGWWQLIETTGGREVPVRDSYYGYGTLYRHVNHGTAILETTLEHGLEQDPTVHALAVRNPNGFQALIVINGSYANPVRVELTFPIPAGAVVQKFATDPVRKYHHFPDFATESNGGMAVWQDVLSPMSITVYPTGPNTPER